MPEASIFSVMYVIECYCKIRSEFYFENRININYTNDKYKEAYKEIVIFLKKKSIWIM